MSITMHQRLVAMQEGAGLDIPSHYSKLEEITEEMREIIPTFIGFLEESVSQNVAIYEGVTALTLVACGFQGAIPRRNLRKDRYSICKRNTVVVDEREIGWLDIFEDPAAFVFEGKIPGFRSKMGSEYVSLSYVEEHPEVKHSGRGDNNNIPFP